MTNSHAPVAGLHRSSVQALPSSQTTGVLEHAPVAGSHLSVVQALPSSQLTGVCVHPLATEVAIRIVPVVEPDMPASGPPGAPTKSIR